MVYNGYAEATRVPPSWHGWLHHTVDVGPDRRELQPARMGKAARPQHDRDARSLPSLRLDAGQRPPSQGDRRLPALDAGELVPTASSSPIAAGHPGRASAPAEAPIGASGNTVRPVNSGNSGDIRDAVIERRRIRGSINHLTEMGDHRVGSGNSSRLPRNAAAADQDVAGR